ncbi:peptidase C45 [Bacillus sp. AFS015802]|uniref:C45 family autoproteolytic acyltransferase/hydolase n=1 Tax=Bacillus sp. AFS015802 TaxID=2033486 RepID=UPI000BF5504A|nr:C45 family peptidase [Bacillus sp. AFS015802]PFA63120.1 peptidase C45 [Bacillus sp. AFS015802]
MSEFNVRILQIRGSSFQIGLQTGELLKDTAILNVLNTITKHDIDYPGMKSIYTSFAPHLIEELEGLAEELGISSRRAAALLSGYDVPKTEAMGCSTLLTSDYYVRNYDFSPDFYDGIFSCVQSDTAFASAGYNLQVLGRHDGVNEKGLAIGLHFVSHEGYRIGVSPWAAIRMVLDTCATAQEAASMLKEIPHCACYNFSLGDRDGQMAVVEASPDLVTVRYGEYFLPCVNHFQEDQMGSKNRPSIEGSLQRNKHLLSLKEKNWSHDQMFHHFKSEESPMFFTDYEHFFGTLHTFSYSYQDSRILTAIAGGGDVLDVNFKDWVNGKDIHEETLSGFIK